ncbi:MAG: penicillin-binding protein activator [Agitococcus sp.]
MSWIRFLSSSLLCLASSVMASETSILLPSTGTTAKTAEFVRNGLLSGYYQSLAQNNHSPFLRFYDTTSSSAIETIIQQSQNNGSQLIIGPLLKEQVAQLVKNPPNIPVLALNRVNNEGLSTLWQFALAPEEEIVPLIKVMQQNGIKKVRVIGLNDANSERLRQAFEQTWTGMGGNLASNYTLTQTATDGFTQSIKKLITEPHNKDVQAFYLASPQSALYIMPLLNFYQHNPPPVYSNSLAYDSQKTSLERQDLNGLSFCGLPWVIEATKWSKPDDEAINDDRLFAFGADAWLLSQHINSSKKIEFNARTGFISVEQGLIYRQPLCAKVSNGNAQALNPTTGTTR